MQTVVLRMRGTYRIAQANLVLMKASTKKNEYQDRLDQLASGSRELYESVKSGLVERAEKLLI